MHRQSLVKIKVITVALPHISFYGKITSHFIFTPLTHEEFFKVQEKPRFFPETKLDKYGEKTHTH